MANDGINRTINIPQPNIFGRIGTGVGKGLAEALPKEIERGRLQQGLHQLGQQKDLNPFQQFSALASLPGTTPQMIQSGSELLRQQAYLNALKNQYEGQGEQKGNKGGYTPTEEEFAQPGAGEVPTLATPESTKQSYKNYIPRSKEQERQDAFQNFNKNPARYHHNFDEALAEQEATTARNKEIQQAYQAQETTAVKKEAEVKQALDKEVIKLGLGNIGEDGLMKLRFIPPEVYQKYEEKMINSILSKEEGGEGLSQEEAAKNISKELEKVNENYIELKTLSSWNPKEFDRRSNDLQKKFSDRGEQKMMMNQMISDYKLSPMYAAHKAYPIQKNEMPTLQKIKGKIGSSRFGPAPVKQLTNIDYEKLKNEMGKKYAPLSIAYELEESGLDSTGFLNYLSNHGDNLEVWQSQQTSKNLNHLDLKDKWLRSWERQ